jgi:hypothetical protein
MSISATFSTDEKGNITATLDTPFSPMQPQPFPTIGASPGVARETWDDPNDPIGFRFDLKSLTPSQLNALQNAAGRNKKEPISLALLIAIDDERKRRQEEDERKRRAEEKRRKKRETRH